jgi:hypothetical protein
MRLDRLRVSDVAGMFDAIGEGVWLRWKDVDLVAGIQVGGVDV